MVLYTVWNAASGGTRTQGKETDLLGSAIVQSQVTLHGGASVVPRVSRAQPSLAVPETNHSQE